MLVSAAAATGPSRGASLAALETLKAKYATKLQTVRAKYWSDLVGLHEELVHLTTQLNPGNGGTPVAIDKHAKLKIFLEHVRKAMKALQMIPEVGELLEEAAVDRLEDHISRVLLPIKVRLETLREAMASETLNLAMLGEGSSASASAFEQPKATEQASALGRTGAGAASPGPVRHVFDDEPGSLDAQSASGESFGFGMEPDMDADMDPLAVDGSDAESLSQTPFDLPFHEIMDDLDEKATDDASTAARPDARAAHGAARERSAGLELVPPSAKRQRAAPATKQTAPAPRPSPETFETVLPCSPEGIAAAVNPTARSRGATSGSGAAPEAAGKEETATGVAAAFNLQPREVKYQCAVCNEAYSVTFNYNPWWALRVEECPHCKKKQVPRLDIAHPTNQIDYHPALNAVAEAMQLNQANEDKENDITTDTESDVNDELALSPEKSSKLLILICHARTCPGKHRSQRHAEVCKSIKYLMLHIRDCSGRLPDGQPCPFEWCRPCKNLLSHLVKCFDPNNCAICNPWNLPSSLQQLKTLNQLREQVNASAVS